MSEEPTNRPRRAMPSGQGEQGREWHGGADDTPALQPTGAPSPKPADQSPPVAADNLRRAARRGFVPDDQDGPVFEETFRAPTRSAVTPNDLPTDPDETMPRLPAVSTGRGAEDADPAGREQLASSSGSPSPGPEADDHAAFRRPEADEEVSRGASRRSRRRAASDSHPQRGDQGDELVVDRSPFRHWWTWAIIAVLLAAIVFVTVSRLNHRSAPGPIASSSHQSTVAPLPSIALMDVSEARTLSPTATWKAGATVSKVDPDSPDNISCVVRGSNHPNPVSTLQRSFTSSAKTTTAVLDRVDGYADEQTATKAFSVEAASLAACDSVPVHIVSAAAFTGLGDQSASVTIAYQGSRTQYRTIVLSRIGREIQAVDAADYGSPVDAQKAGAAMATAAARSCRAAGGTCPANVTSKPAVPPVAGDRGWPITSDFPRITPDQGQWSQTQVVNVSRQGTGCEGVTLATVSGPTARQQRTYLLTQDSSAPDGFGVDELLFTFGDAKGSAALTKKIGDNIASCSKSSKTATISDAKAFTTIGENNTAVSGRSFIVTQDTGSGDKAIYQVAVASAGTRTVYLLANIAPSYRFSDTDWTALAQRAAQRATQG